MRKVLCVSVALAALSLMSGEAIAQTASPYQQLLQTRDCMGCNLSNLDLKGLDLAGANLQNANLSNANLSGANLSGANLSGADLYLSTLGDANLSQARLDNANVRSGNFSNATLSQSSLLGVTATYANFSNANFSGAVLSNSNFSDADLTGADFSSASVVNSKFNNARLDQANMASATVQGTSFLSASTEGTILPVENANEIVGEAPSSSPTLSGAEKEGALTPAENFESGETSSNEVVNATPYDAIQTPLAYDQVLTAQTAPGGAKILNYHQRFFDSDTGIVQGTGTPFFGGPGIRLGITDGLEVSASFQVFDSGYLSPLGGRTDDPNYNLSLEAKKRIWQSDEKNLILSGIVSTSIGLSEGATFNRNGGTSRVGTGGVVPALQVPLTWLAKNQRASVTLAPTVAFFQNDSAVLVPRVPDVGGNFGTTFGLAGSATFRVVPRLMLWGEGFVPFTGNNSLNFTTERPDKTVAFDTGIRFFPNPRIGLDLFVTNALGNAGPLALAADQDDIAIGAGISVMPDLFAWNRQFPNNFSGKFNAQDTSLTTDGFAFFDGGTVPAGKLVTQFQGGNGGVMAALRYGVLKDFEFGTYLDYTLGDVDESEQGVSAKVRLLNQQEGAPLTVSVAATLGRGNNLLENFRNNDATIFTNSGFNKSFPFILSGDGANKLGTLFIGTVSLPMQYQVSEGTALWLTPTASFLQRGGFSLAGVSAGGSLRVFKDVSVLGELGAVFGDSGNAFVNDRLVDRIPWNVGVRWQPSSLFGTDFTDKLAKPSLELFVTNRVGSSAFQQMRVREGNDPAVVMGLTLPLF